MQDGVVDVDTLEVQGNFASQFVMWDGTLKVNRVLGATGQASFGGNVEIGVYGPNGGGTTVLDPGSAWNVCIGWAPRWAA